MIMKSKLLLIICLFGISACAASGERVDASIPAPDYYVSNHGGKITMFTKDGATYKLLPSNPGQVTDPSITVDTTNTTPRQGMVTGVASLDSYQGGSISIEALEAEACESGYCPVAGKKPLASTSLSQPGYFSLIVTSRGQGVILSATHSAADSKSYAAQTYVGVVDKRINDIQLKLQ